MNQIAQNNWSEGFRPPRANKFRGYKTCSLPKSDSDEGYEVESEFFTLFIGIVRAKWSKPTVRLKAKQPPPQIKESPKAPLPPQNVAAIQLLRSWRMEAEEEQRETWEFLKQALDEDRPSDRKFFS